MGVGGVSLFIHYSVLGLEVLSLSILYLLSITCVSFCRKTSPTLWDQSLTKLEYTVDLLGLHKGQSSIILEPSAIARPTPPHLKTNISTITSMCDPWVL